MEQDSAINSPAKSLTHWNVGEGTTKDAQNRVPVRSWLSRRRRHGFATCTIVFQSEEWHMSDLQAAPRCSTRRWAWPSTRRANLPSGWDSRPTNVAWRTTPRRLLASIRELMRIAPTEADAWAVFESEDIVKHTSSRDVLRGTGLRDQANLDNRESRRSNAIRRNPSRSRFGEPHDHQP